MAINAWWVPNPEQRYWMEATDRPDLGGPLRAPQGGTANQPVWNYELVAFTKPGDIVFHWHTTQAKRPAIVGWSVIAGPLSVGNFAWTPKQGYGKDEIPEPRPHWVMPLGDFHLLDAPITLDELTQLRDQVLALRIELESHIDGPSYFPFNKYGATNIRAMQGYLTKFPAELVDLLSENFDLEIDGYDSAGSEGGGSIGVPTDPSIGGQGALSETARRLAIEQWAVQRAIEYYSSIGATSIEVLGKPYDLRLHLKGDEVHVEVKGSSMTTGTVIVTRNEVKHAHDWARTELFVVDGISTEWMDDQLVASGGVSRRWVKWTPTPESLRSRTYDHVLGADFEMVE